MKTASDLMMNRELIRLEGEVEFEIPEAKAESTYLAIERDSSGDGNEQILGRSSKAVRRISCLCLILFASHCDSGQNNLFFMTALLNFGLPKGSLEDPTIKLFERAGFSISKGSRSYKPCWDDDDLDGRFVRAQEMSRYVEDGFFDCGLTGRDWVEENASDVEIVSDLVYSRASNRISKWVLAVPEQSEIQSASDLEGKTIATELVGVTQKYLQKHGVTAEVEFSWGATEVKVPELVDAIVDLTETGSSLRANKLRIVDVLMETNTVLIANKVSWRDPQKRAKIENISLMLQAAYMRIPRWA